MGVIRSGYFTAQKKPVKLMNWIRKLIIESKEVCAQSQVPEAAISHPKILLNLLGKGLLRKHSIEKLMKVGSSI